MRMVAIGRVGHQMLMVANGRIGHQMRMVAIGRVGLQPRVLAGLIVFKCVWLQMGGLVFNPECWLD